MNTIRYPKKKDWPKLCQRPAKKTEALNTLVSKVFADIQRQGDKAVMRYSKAFDGADLANLNVSRSELSLALKAISPDLKSAIALAKGNIEMFHRTQLEKPKRITTIKGVMCWRESRAISRVGIYIPGGTAPLFSTVLMLGIPAKLADCKEIILCTPPNADGTIHPAILYAAQLVGVTQIVKLGGIQAIGAMTFGTASVPKVDKLFGPGNQYVTAAKQKAQQHGVAIDMPAGPSEVLIIADKNSVPEFVAADLLSQAEHGSDSQVVLLSDNAKVISDTLAALEQQTKKLSRKKLVQQSLKNSKAILLNSIEECLLFSNSYAPEHLILAVKDSNSYIRQIENAGSVFLGNYSCESAGDYASGTNHTLPTNGYARNYSGVSVDSFVKKITFQEVTAVGLQNIGPAIELMAAAEQLDAHKNAVSIRLAALSKTKKTKGA
jgi:histidinol dehydrogenase